MRIIFSLCFLHQFNLFETKLFAQQIDSFPLGLVPLNPLLNTYYDSIDNSDFCKNKEKEFLYLRTKLLRKLDSARVVVKELREKNPGRIYYLEFREKEFFDYKTCYARKRKEDWSHGLGAYVTNVELRIKEEGRFHNNADGSSGWTIYRDEIQKTPK